MLPAVKVARSDGRDKAYRRRLQRNRRELQNGKKKKKKKKKKIVTPLKDNTWDVSGQAAQSIPHSRDDAAAGVDVEVQICNLRDLYEKKTKKGHNGFEYRLENTKITIIAKAIQLQSVQVLVQRCPDAAIKTHDTIGPMELQAISQQHDISRTIVTVDLDSVYKTNRGEHVYRLEKAEVEQRNKWELIVLLHFVDGSVASVKSKSFRVTTKSSQKSRKENQHSTGPWVHEPLVQKICERVVPADVGATDCFFQSPTWHVDHEFNPSSHTSESGASPHPHSIPNTVDPDVDNVALELQQELLKLNVDSEDSLALPCSQPPTPSGAVVYGRVVLRHTTPLDGERVTRHYNLDTRVRYAVEQTDLAGLMKIMGKKFNWTGGRRRANGHKAAEENFWWSCGFCFFERRKKSTVKAHVIQQVCQRSTERREQGQSVTPRQMTRCPSYETALDSSGSSYASSWKNTLSV